jgi:hypothetical protein
MKVGIGLVAALAVAIMPLGAASAQSRSEKASAAELAKLRDRGMKEAPGLVQAKGYACTVTDAIFLGEQPTLDDKGKPVKGAKPKPVYEVACQDGLGFIFGDPDPAPLDCLKLTTSAERQKAEGQKVTVPLCRIPANGDGQQSVYPLARKAGVACTPNKARWVGEDRGAKTDIYELACTEGDSYLITSPQPGSTTKMTADSCAQAVLRGSNLCQFVSKEQALGTVKALAAKAGKACTVSDAKFVGQKTSGGAYYEIACADGKTGFMVETNTQGAFSRAIDCGLADNIGGGCTLTQVSTAGDTQDLPIYVRKMKEIGHPCVPSKYRSLGAEPGNTNREIVELACANQAEGVFALIPLAAGAKGETYNCARAEARQQNCRLTDKKLAFPALSERIKSKANNCQISDSRGVGQANGNQDVIEVACGGSPGYMVIFLAGSEAVSQVMPCAQAGAIGGGCKLK